MLKTVIFEYAKTSMLKKNTLTHSVRGTFIL